MWCGIGGRSYSCELNDIDHEPERFVYHGSNHHRNNTNHDILDTLFEDPSKALDDFVDLCKNAVYNSQLGRLFRTLRKSITGQGQGQSRRERTRHPARRMTSVTKQEEQRNKHVMFADSLGLDLELIHTIQINNQASDQLDKLITKQTFVNSYNANNNNHSHNKNSQRSINSDKLIVPKCVLSPDRNYEKLIKNGICLNSIEIYNQSSVRGVILTLTKSGAESGSLGEDDRFESKNYFKPS